MLSSRGSSTPIRAAAKKEMLQPQKDQEYKTYSLHSASSCICPSSVALYQNLCWIQIHVQWPTLPLLDDAGQLKLLMKFRHAILSTLLFLSLVLLAKFLWDIIKPFCFTCAINTYWQLILHCCGSDTLLDKLVSVFLSLLKWKLWWHVHTPLQTKITILNWRVC